MATAEIRILLDSGDEFTDLEAVAEALFNFGIGRPDSDGLGWPNMLGQAYEVVRITHSVETNNSHYSFVKVGWSSGLDHRRGGLDQ